MLLQSDQAGVQAVPFASGFFQTAQTALHNAPPTGAGLDEAWEKRNTMHRTH
jgi:hypothetical protein